MWNQLIYSTANYLFFVVLWYPLIRDLLLRWLFPSRLYMVLTILSYVRRQSKKQQPVTMSRSPETTYKAIKTTCFSMLSVESDRIPNWKRRINVAHASNKVIVNPITNVRALWREQYIWSSLKLFALHLELILNLISY